MTTYASSCCDRGLAIPIYEDETDPPPEREPVSWICSVCGWPCDREEEVEGAVVFPYALDEEEEDS